MSVSLNRAVTVGDYCEGVAVIWACLVRDALTVVMHHLPEAERQALDLIETLFNTHAVFKQLQLALLLQGTVMFTKSLYHTARYLLSQLSERSKQVRKAHVNLSHATSLTEWQEIAQKIDVLEGNFQWRIDPNCELYERRRLEDRIAEFNNFFSKGDIHNMMFIVRGGITRSKYGLLHEGLFSKAVSGTKKLIEEYSDKVCSSLDAICEGEDKDGNTPFTVHERLAFFNETRHGYGRTALLLSGGAALGFYHVGVVKALVENHLMPRVISGASAGSIVAAMVATRTDEELIEDLFCVKGTDSPGHSGKIRLDFFRPPNYSVGKDYSSADVHLPDKVNEVLINSAGFFSNFKRMSQFMIPRSIQWFSSMLLDVLTGNTKAKDILQNDTSHFSMCCKKNVGNFTFQEAFDRTGRILNITVSPHNNKSDQPRLLNYLTSPHVLVWSAAVCSSALPGVFQPQKLFVKTSDGSIRDESTSGACFVDGSMENDLPMQQLSEMFNVNHFLISQVNPHAFMLSSVSSGQTVWTGAVLGFANGILAFLKNQMKSWLRNIVVLAGGRRLAPLWEIRRGFFTQLLTQEYEGRDIDITINPWKSHRGIFSAFLHCIFNPSDEDFFDWIVAAEKETWKHLAAIKSHCAVESKLDQAVQTLRNKIIDESSFGNNSSVKDKKMGWLGNRNDSFRQTQLDLSVLSGLGITDTNPLSVDSGSSKDLKRRERKAKEKENAMTMGDDDDDDDSEDDDDDDASEDEEFKSRRQRSGSASSAGSAGRGGSKKYVKCTNSSQMYYRDRSASNSKKNGKEAGN